ncbi:EAL domain-containing protein [Celerinatantimonas sp. YJH-8]|uniref:sensor domain-containing phosphodiesterase n=1 Tax=Celerinatantimonas sp. YJH-8 TaxID=3228714 RepID=UPI0038C72BDD
MTYQEIKPGWIAAMSTEQEELRLAELKKLNVLDTAPEDRFDLLVKLAKHIAGGQSALLTLVDDKRQWFKSKIGLQHQEHPKSWSFCAHTINEKSGFLVIEDTTQDKRFYANPLVTDAPHIRSYIGCSIVSPNGLPIGTICVLDSRPHHFTPDQIQQMMIVAKVISGELWRDQKIVESQNELLEQTLYDPLTGLPSQQLLIHRLEIVCRNMADQGYQLFLLNIQRFRVINRIYGRAFGDELLRILVKEIKPLLPQDALFARMRDDRFAILLQSNGNSSQSKFLLRLRSLLEAPLVIREPSLLICCSIGMASISEDFNIADEVLNRANTAMRSAPELPNGISFESHDPKQELLLERSIEIEKRLREAIHEDGFEMVYQPIVRLIDGQMIGVEALIRWQWKKGEYLSPVEFIPIAEECGIIQLLSRWVIETTCKEFASVYQKLPQPTYMSVNISSADLLDLNFTDFVLEMLSKYQLPAQCLKFEVTEHSVINDIDLAISQMKKLQNSGIRFAIDDFGTGHASLRYLQLLPAGILKIDRSFINGVTTMERDAVITRATIALAHSLNKHVIAEGVEELAQADFLRQHHAEYAQGWFYAKPVPIGMLENYRPPEQP